jgi:hypothetical protein
MYLMECSPLDQIRKRERHVPGAVRSIIMAAVGVLVLLVANVATSLAESYHWVDRDGFHSYATITEVPLEHRRDLPMVKNRTSLPFTREENGDGSLYVWFMLGQAGIHYEHVTTAAIPESSLFVKIATPQDGDIAWWPRYAALYRDSDRVVLTAEGAKSLPEMVRKNGKVTWYHYQGEVVPGQIPDNRKAPLNSLKKGDRLLAGLGAAAVNPPEIKDDAELERLKKRWRSARAELESLRRLYPDDPRILWRLGECYRIGNNLGISGAWERAEAFLLRAEELAPEEPQPYISLGAHYADTGYEQGALAEAQFRQALGRAGKKQLPQVWWGLAISLYYQGKTKEALQYADRLIAAYPGDPRGTKLKDIILGNTEKK